MKKRIILVTIIAIYFLSLVLSPIISSEESSQQGTVIEIFSSQVGINTEDEPEIPLKIGVEKVFTLNVKAKDDTGIKHVQYKIDDATWNAMQFIGNNEYTADFDTTELKDGAHELSVQAQDRAGKKIIESLPFYIKNKKSDDTLTRTPGFEGIFLLVVILLIVFYIRINRRKNNF